MGMLVFNSRLQPAVRFVCQQFKHNERNR